MSKPEIHPSEIKIEDFIYELPDERIARFPLEQRDQSKILIYKDGQIEEDIYHNLTDHIPEKSLMIFNRAKVIHARLYFQKTTGKKMEIFCLEPDSRYPDIATAMMQENEIYWKCLVKGAAKWKDDSAIVMETDFVNADGQTIPILAKAEKVSREGNSFIIKFSWQSNTVKSMSFSEFLEHAGKIPIPPYLKRESEASDDIRYQTIFAEKEGSVAAPTASLHFTPTIMEQLKEKAVDSAKLTLHVGAGTFMPVKSDNMAGHEMHAEWIEFSLELLEKLANQLNAGNKVICVGTTSARTLESIYWIGVKMLRNEWQPETEIGVEQWYPYREGDDFSAIEAVNAVIQYLNTNHSNSLITKTRLIIAPGYDFKLLDGLITNFHQPASTLLLMVSALVGEDWKKIYQYALNHDFRFLSYGDGSLLWK